MQNHDPLKQIMRYEEQLKGILQQVDIMILDNNPNNRNHLAEMVDEQNKLIKILEVESSRLNPQSKSIYNRNLAQFKKKNRQHQQYMTVEYGKNFLPQKKDGFNGLMEFQKQNMQLAGDKLTMYDNQRTQNFMGRELHYQGEQLQRGITQNRDIREEASGAQSTINLIQLAILKRKVMFLSLIIFFILSVIIVAIVKLNKKQ